MSVAVVMPARLESSRLRHKLLLDQTGKTVLEHTISKALEAQALSSGLIQTVLVACDDEVFLEVVRRGGGQAVLTRKDHQSGTDRIAEAVQNLNADIIVNLQADEPEMDPESILKVALLLAEKNDGCAMSTLAVPIVDEGEFLKPSVVKVVMDREGKALYFSRAPIPYARDRLVDPKGRERTRYGFHHLGIYAYRRPFLLSYASLPASHLEGIERLEQLRALEAGYAIRVGVVDESPPGIDTAEDYAAFVARWKAGLPHGSGERGRKDA